jgi:hypothetical protein
MTDREFIERLSGAKLDQAEAIENDIHAILKEGFSEDVAYSFVRAVMAIRDLEPESTVGGIYEAALKVGLREVVVRLLADRKHARRTGRTAGTLR